jgi:serine/threonine-protein kinase
MGEVWRARDAKLGREVALKLLPAAFAADPERLARFEREAKVLASLSHSGIAHVYGFEALPAADGAVAHVLVMELAEGEDLSERMKRGPIPLEEALPIARQVAEALEAAHEKGIVHRDLKPQNVKLSRDGKVKVLDFGLAKAMAPPGTPSAGDLERSPTLMNSPTLTSEGTRAGVILGTAAYMAPEQAKGLPVDKRADVWAFGVLVWEMLSGRRLFSGDSVADTLAAVLRGEIDFGALPAESPAALRQLLRRCLARNPKNRLHDVADARIVLDEVLSGRPQEEAPALPPPPGPRRAGNALAWPAALVAVAALAAGAGWLARRPDASPAEPLRLSFHLSPEQEVSVGSNSTLAFSPDGRSLVFAGREKGRQSLYRRAFGEREAVAIPGTEGGDSPFFSPDGRWLGFVAGGAMKKVPAEGGRPFRLADQSGAGGCTWIDAKTIVLAPIYSDGLFRVSADGGTPERLTTPDRAHGELGHWWPDPLPGGRRVIFTAFRTPVDTSRIGVLDLETRKVSWVVEGGFYGRWVPTGHLLYAKGQRLYAVPFDPSSATVKGAAVAVLDDLLVSQTGGFAALAVSSRGTLAYVSESLGNPPSALVWLDRTGRDAPAATERHRFRSVSLSPDGRQAAITIQDESRDLWTASLERGTLSRLTTGDGTEFDPVWSRDGRELFYVVDRPPFQLHRIGVGSPDGGRPIWDETPVFDTVGVAVHPDGKTIAFEVTEEGTGKNLYSRPLDGSAPPRAIRATKASEERATFSPDGRWIAYASNETGRPEIYAEPFPGPGERVQVSPDGGTEPVWAGNGELFYRRDDEVRVVATSLSAPSPFGAPRTLFSFPIVPASVHESRTYDVTADGSRLIAVTVPEASRPRQVEIVTDWTRELARLAPAGRK